MSDIEQSVAAGEPATDAVHPMELALEQSFALSMPVAGEVREGQVVLANKNEVLIDIGAKSEAIISGREIDSLDEASRVQLDVGNTVTVLVVNPEDRDGNIIVSYAKALEENDWVVAADLLESQEIYESEVVGYNKGGLLVRVGRLRGFVPASQLSRARQLRRNSASNENILSAAVGKPLYAKVIEVNRNRNRLILSERTADREVRSVKRKELLEALNEGDIRVGRVVNLADFGAFIDIGGVEGLVHLSELSWKRINNPSDVLEVGDEVKVYVLNVDEERQRVALSMKRLQPDPWEEIDEYYQVGQLVPVVISKLARYGAFATINDDFGLEGLVHISELAEEHVKHPGDVVEKGQEMTARIIRIDAEQRQIGLSLKQVMSDRFLDMDLALADQDLGD